MTNIRPASFADLFLSFVGLRTRYRVRGDSMFPLLCAGDIVFAKSARKNKVVIGDIVVVRHPYTSALLVKRVEDLDNESCIVRGLNKKISSDSSSFGAIPLKSVLGCVVSRA